MLIHAFRIEDINLYHGNQFSRFDREISVSNSVCGAQKLVSRLNLEIYMIFSQIF